MKRNTERFRLKGEERKILRKGKKEKIIVILSTYKVPKSNSINPDFSTTTTGGGKGNLSA
jgi:hypothetical protein